MTENSNYRQSVIFQVAVVPFYRKKFFLNLSSELANICKLIILTGEQSLNQEVKSDNQLRGIMFQNIVSLPFGFYWHQGNLGEIFSCSLLVTDKNPRSLNAWVNLFLRRIARRKTYIWGHSKSRTNNTKISRIAHQAMNFLSSGIFLYTPEECANLRTKRKVFVAPNAILLKSECLVDENSARKNIVYSGRLEKSKDLDKLIIAFSKSAMQIKDANLIIIGDGSCRNNLRLLANSLGMGNRIEFLGEISDSKSLAKIYASARIAIGPGYGGLNITQANCFGVPIILNKFGQHAPEIALTKFKGVFTSDFSCVEDMARSIRLYYEVLDWEIEQRKVLSKNVSERYNFTNMVEAFAQEFRAQLEKENY